MFSENENDLKQYKLRSLERTCREKQSVRIGSYIVKKQNKNELFTDFNHVSLSKSLDTGWKAHISMNPEKIDEAFQLLIPILLAHNVLQFKFSDIRMMDKYLEVALKKNNQAFLKETGRLRDGMQLTIYMKEGQEIEFNHMLLEIETRLKEAGITPGVIDASTDRVLGEYASIRHQGTEKHLDSKDIHSYNPEDVEDPFVELHELKLRPESGLTS